MKANIFIIAAVFLLCACGDKKQTADEKTSSGAVNQNTVKLNEAQLRNAGIETGDLVQREISGTLKLSGKIDVPPQNMISVSVP
ncbi:hypothetical protein [Mucilaginibacter sp.]|nr:hypothetical protein [Mucilaginibacter sp.]